MAGGDENSVGTSPPPSIPATTGSEQSSSTTNATEASSDETRPVRPKQRRAITQFAPRARPRTVVFNPEQSNVAEQLPRGHRPRAQTTPLHRRTVNQSTPPPSSQAVNAYSVENLRTSFGGLIERIAGGAQTVTTGYDKVARAHIDNIRAALNLKGEGPERVAAHQYLNYLEQLLPPRPNTEPPFESFVLPNGEMVSAENLVAWERDYQNDFTTLKGDWALVAGEIASLQNASNVEGAVQRIKVQLAATREKVEALRTRNTELPQELDEAVEHILAYQAYLEAQLTKKEQAIEDWANELGAGTAGAFQTVNESLNKSSVKNRELQQRLSALRSTIDQIPESVHSGSSKEFLQAQAKFLQRQLLAQEIWKRSHEHSLEHGSPDQTGPDFLKARLFLHQNAFTALDRITARHAYTNQLLERFGDLDMTSKSMAARNIRDLLIRNQQQFDELIKSIEPPLKSSVVKALLFDAFKETQDEIAKTLKRVESTPTPVNKQPT